MHIGLEARSSGAKGSLGGIEAGYLDPGPRRHDELHARPSPEHKTNKTMVRSLLSSQTFSGYSVLLHPSLSLSLYQAWGQGSVHPLPRTRTRTCVSWQDLVPPGDMSTGGSA